MIEQKEDGTATSGINRRRIFLGAKVIYDSDFSDLMVWYDKRSEFYVVDIATHSVMMDFGCNEFANLKHILANIELPDLESLENGEVVLHEDGRHTVICRRSNEGEKAIKWNITDRHRCSLLFREIKEALKAIDILDKGNKQKGTRETT